MYDFEAPLVTLILILISPFVVILLAVVLAIFCLIVDAVAFVVSSFIHDIRSQRNSKEN